MLYNMSCTRENDYIQIDLEDICVINKTSTDGNTTVCTSDFPKICRICFAEEKLSLVSNLLLEENIKLIDVIQEYVGLQILDEDKLPQNICFNCLREFVRFYFFNKQCLQNDLILKTALSESCGNESDGCEIDLNEYNGNPDYDDSNGGDKVDSNDVDWDEDKPLSLRIQKNRSKIFRLKSQYKCRNCSEVCSTKEELKQHRRDAKHSEIRNHCCKVCNKLFTSSKLRQHMRVHTKEKPYQCQVCDQGFSMSGNLKRHVMTHTGERPHVCKFCGKGFIQAVSLHSHLKTHASSDTEGAGNQNFVCNFCGKSFKRLAPYKVHLKKHNSDFSESDEKKALEQSIEVVREHICTICNRAYKTKHLLKAHTLTHGEKTFLCSNCGKGFVTKAALQSHLKVHTGEKPHTCTICKKSFAHVGSFDSHMLIHTGQKPYNCLVCPKSFTQLSHLKYHMRTHSGERPYSCSYCGKSFALKGNLTVHVRTHTGETPYLCTWCSKGFYDSSSMKKHRRSHRSVEHSEKSSVQEKVLMEDVKTAPDSVAHRIDSTDHSYHFPPIEIHLNSMMPQINVL